MNSRAVSQAFTSTPCQFTFLARAIRCDRVPGGAQKLCVLRRVLRTCAKLALRPRREAGTTAVPVAGPAAQRLAPWAASCTEWRVGGMAECARAPTWCRKNSTSVLAITNARASRQGECHGRADLRQLIRR
jgi:hypothetical protein